MRSTTAAILAVLAAHAAALGNRPLFVDMVQNDPGDPTVGWQGSKYLDPALLGSLNYTARGTTGELSPFLTADFSSLNVTLWPAGSGAALWVSTMEEAIRQHGEDAHALGLQFVAHVDMIVFPRALVALYASAILNDNGQIVYNNVTAMLVRTMLVETFTKYSDVLDGIIVRTGETYVFDTPLHQGNSPVASVPSGSQQVATWQQFIGDIRQVICEQMNRTLVFRAWDSFGGWSGDPTIYLNITAPIPTHPNLYFSIKHTAGDFFRHMPFNQQLGVGQHCQIVEVELQREYEGKLATPNYFLPGLLYGFNDLPDGQDSHGLIDLLALPQICGLWTWSRGGGWWGPYIHFDENWVDLHVRVLARWWSINYPAIHPTTHTGASGRPTEVITEEEAFAQVVEEMWGIDPASVAGQTLRAIALNSSQAVLNGHYCPEGDYDNCWIWTRDDRLGGLQQLGPHFQWLRSQGDTAFNASLAFKQQSVAQWTAMLAAFDAQVTPALRKQPSLRLGLRVSIDYGLRLYSIIATAWSIFIEGYKHDAGLPFDLAALTSAINSYDAQWLSFQAFGLAWEHAPSLYYPYYFNEPGSAPQPGMNATVDTYRPLVPPLPRA